MTISSSEGHLGVRHALPHWALDALGVALKKNLMKNISTKLAALALATTMSATLCAASAPAWARPKETRPAQGKNAPVGTNKEMEAAIAKLEKRVAALERRMREMERNKPERPGAGRARR